MNIIVCCKIVPNEEEISVLPSRELSMDGASLKISQYDLNAMESGKKLAAETGGSVAALSIGADAWLENTKIRKDILSRGTDELNLVVDDAHNFSDSLQTGTLLHLPVVNNVTKITAVSDNTLEAERTLEEVEVLEVILPAVLSVSSEINIPAVPNMREIMRAGKKPVKLGCA